MIGRIAVGELIFTEEDAERAKEELVLEENSTRGFTFPGPDKSETGESKGQNNINQEKIEEMIEKTIKSMGFVMPNSTTLEEDGGSVLEALEELRAKVNSLSSRSETLEAGEKLGIINRLKQMVKIKSRRDEVSKQISPKDIEELKEKVESLEKKKERELGEEDLGGRIVEEKLV